MSRTADKGTDVAQLIGVTLQAINNQRARKAISGNTPDWKRYHKWNDLTYWRLSAENYICQEAMKYA